MFYRRKIILALIEFFDGELEKIRLQKLLFLFCQKQEKPITILKQVIANAIEAI
jgi:hypothetical protein